MVHHRLYSRHPPSSRTERNQLPSKRGISHQQCNGANIRQCSNAPAEVPTYQHGANRKILEKNLTLASDLNIDFQSLVSSGHDAYICKNKPNQHYECACVGQRSRHPGYALTSTKIISQAGQMIFGVKCKLLNCDFRHHILLK